jgi:autotransporter-associated beta strand protein
VSDAGEAKAVRFDDSGGVLPATYAGNLTIDETIDGNFSINVGAGASLTISGAISGTGAAGLKKAGSGNLTLTGTNNTYTGPTTVAAGILTLSSPSLDDLSTVNIATGATLNLPHTSTDIVAGIVIDGIPSAPGIYKAVGAAGAGTELNVLLGTGKLQIAAGAPSFTSWMAGYTFEEGADLSVGGDVDHDGIANLIEHVFGTAPNAATAGTSPLTASSASVTFTHPLNPAIVGGVNYEYQWSTDLTEWRTSGEANASGVIAMITPSAPVADVTTFTVTVTAGSTAKLFVRLVATLAP